MFTVLSAMTTGELLTAILGSGALSALVTFFASRRKTAAEAAQIITDAATSLVGPLKAEIELLHNEVEKLKGEVVKLHNGVAILSNQLQDNGLKPAWRPTATAWTPPKSNEL